MVAPASELLASTDPPRTRPGTAPASWCSGSPPSASSTATSAPRRSTRSRSASPASTASPRRTPNVLGILSLVFWSLLLVVVVKYLTFIMRADNHGEGGILALLALLRPAATAALAAHHARPLRRRAALRRRHHHAGDLGPERGRGPRGRRAEPRALRRADHGRDPRRALPRPAPRHRRRRRRLRTGDAGVVRQHRARRHPVDRRRRRAS